MNELAAILRAAKAARDRGETPILATVVATRGSSYRRPGARMLVSARGWEAGSISGGCLELDVARRATHLSEQAQAVLKTYDTSADEDGAAATLGCGGELDVLLEPLRADGFLEALSLVTQGRKTVQVRTGLQGDALGRHEVSADGRVVWSDLSTAAHGLVFTEEIRPSPRLLIGGAGHDAMVLSALAVTLGWDVHVVDWRPSFAQADRFQGASVRVVVPAALQHALPVEPGCAAIVMSHHAQYDRALLEMLSGRSEVSYLGVLGPKKRTTELCEGLRLSRVIHAPAGFDLGGDGPSAVALSILAEVQATLAQASGAPLRLKAGPIHP